MLKSIRYETSLRVCLSFLGQNRHSFFSSSENQQASLINIVICMLNIYLSNVSSVKYTLIDCYFTQMNSKYSLDTMSESVSARDRGRREGLPGSGCYSHVGQLICLFYCEEKLRFWHIFEYHLVQAYFAELPT